MDNINLIFRECFCNPISEKNQDEEISKIYDIDNDFYYLHFYKYNEKYTDNMINEDKSILFTESIGNTSILFELSKLIENNSNKIKIILTKFFIFNDYFNLEIINFIKKRKIPILIIESNISNIIYEYFVEGKGNLFNYTKINKNSKIFYNTLLNNDENIRKENCMIKKEKDDKIENNDKKNENDEIFMDVGSLFETGSDKKTNDIEKKIAYDELINKPKRFFKFGAIKLSKRLIYDIIYENNFNFSEIKKIIGDVKTIINIFNYMCMEFYYNANLFINNIDFFRINNTPLKNQLNKYLLFLSSEKLNINNNNEWFLKYFEYLKECLLITQESEEKYKSLSLSNYLSKLDYNKSPKNNLYNKILFSCQDVEYDVFLFFTRNCLDNCNFPIKKFLDLIEINTKYLLKINFTEDTLTSISYNESFNKIIKKYTGTEIKYIFEIMNNLYEYYINNINNEKKVKKFKELLIYHEINKIMKQLIEHNIDLQTYFYDPQKEGNLNYSKMRIQQISLEIEYALKYFDFCLLLYLKREDKLNLFEKLICPMKDIFKLYCNYKLLTIDKNSDNISDEIYSLLAYIIFLYRKGFDKTIKINVNEEENNLKMNKINI